MRLLKRAALIVVGLVVLGVIVLWGRSFLYSLQSDSLAQCERIKGMPGSEDVEIDYARSLIYVSSDDRHAARAGNPERGAIFLLDFSDTNQGLPGPVKMTGFDEIERFFPHGISIYQDGEVNRLFVISHNIPLKLDAGHAIHIFDIDGDTLKLVETVVDPAIRAPNDIVAVGPNQFYVTNDRTALTGWDSRIEIITAQRKSNVVYFDGKTVRKVIDDLAYSSGIHGSPDRSAVYVSQVRADELKVFERDPETGDLTFLRDVEVGPGSDNVNVDEAGEIWLPRFPSFFDAARQNLDPSTRAPFSIEKIDGQDFSVENIISHDGSELTSVSVATGFGDRVILGTIYEDGIMICPNTT